MTSDQSRVTIRAVEQEDLDAIASYLNMPECWGRRGIEGDRHAPMSRAEIVSRIEEWVKPEHSEVFVIDAGGEVAGHVRADWWWDALTPTVWAVVAPAHRRQGVGTEAVRRQISHLFADTVAETVQVWVEEGSPGHAFACGLGFTAVGRVRRVGVVDGRYVDAIPMDLLRREWEADGAADR